MSLELGGKSPHIIFESADLDQGGIDSFIWGHADAELYLMSCDLAANWVALGILYNTGQDCTAGSRLFVQESIYNKFVPMLVEKAKELVITHGFDEHSSGGPVVGLSCRGLTEQKNK